MLALCRVCYYVALLAPIILARHIPAPYNCISTAVCALLLVAGHEYLIARNARTRRNARELARRVVAAYEPVTSLKTSELDREASPFAQASFD